MFATVLFGILDTRSGVLTYINCGHIRPLVLSQEGMKQTLERTGPALGAVLDSMYAIQEVALERGDLLFAYTDGLTDSENPNEKIFTIDRLLPILVQAQPLPQLMDQIIQGAEARSMGDKLYDDITMLAVRRV